jgi:hypothetical protein
MLYHKAFFVQQVFSALNPVLNTSKTKVVWFGKKTTPLPAGVITTFFEGLELEVVTSYKYLGVWLDGILNLVSSIVIAALLPTLPNEPRVR